MIFDCRAFLFWKNFLFRFRQLVKSWRKFQLTPCENIKSSDICTPKRRKRLMGI